VEKKQWPPPPLPAGPTCAFKVHQLGSSQTTTSGPAVSWGPWGKGPTAREDSAGGNYFERTLPPHRLLSPSYPLTARRAAQSGHVPRLFFFTLQANEGRTSDEPRPVGRGFSGRFPSQGLGLDQNKPARAPGPSVRGGGTRQRQVGPA
jgi:hypothetical protein